MRSSPGRSAASVMSWTDLNWPNLSPKFKVPEPALRPPPKPHVQDDIERRVAHAERLRHHLVILCLGLATVCFVTGLLLYAGIGDVHATRPALLLLAVGLLTAFPLAALLALIFGPRWWQRQQHWQLLRWRQLHEVWVARERERYVASLPPRVRTEFRHVVDRASESCRSKEPPTLI